MYGCVVDVPRPGTRKGGLSSQSSASSEEEPAEADILTKTSTRIDKPSIACLHLHHVSALQGKPDYRTRISQEAVSLYAVDFRTEYGWPQIGPPERQNVLTEPTCDAVLSRTGKKLGPCPPASCDKAPVRKAIRLAARTNRSTGSYMVGSGAKQPLTQKE